MLAIEKAQKLKYKVTKFSFKKERPTPMKSRPEELKLALKKKKTMRKGKQDCLGENTRSTLTGP